MAAGLGARSAFPGIVITASAVHAAALSLPSMAAIHPPAEGENGAVASFASQLLGLTGGAALDLPGASNLAQSLRETANDTITPAVILPRQISRPVVVLPVMPATSKRPPVDHKQPQKPSADAAQLAPVVAPTPAPVPEIAATIAAAAGAAVDNVESEIAVQPPAPRIAQQEGPAEPAEPNVTAAAAPAQPQEMAFAARVQPVQSTQHSALPAEMASTAAVASANKKIAPAAEDQHSPAAAEPHALLNTTPTEIVRTAEPAAVSSPAPHQVASAHRTEGPAAITETASKSTTPLKDISLQVNQPGKERVDVRVVQQGSEVHVSVHSGDAGLTSGLRQGLSDLQSRLEETGYRSEMWRPGVVSAPVAASPSAQSSDNHQHGGDGQSQQQGGSQQESGRRNQNQSNQPRWVEEMESSFGGEKLSGGFYGFTS